MINKTIILLKIIYLKHEVSLNKFIIIKFFSPELAYLNNKYMAQAISIVSIKFFFFLKKLVRIKSKSQLHY